MISSIQHPHPYYCTHVYLIIYLFVELSKIDFSLFFLIGFIVTLFYQILKFNENKSEDCLKMFKLNNLSGFFLFLSLVTINI